MKVVIAAAAAADIRNIVTYIAVDQHNPGAAERVAQSLTDSIEGLAEFPTRHPISRLVAEQFPGTRQLSVGPFLVFYRVGEDVIEVARVMHGARDILGSYDET